MRRIFTLLSFILFLGFINHVSAQTYCTPTYATTCCMGFTNVSFGTINNSNAQYGSGYENYTATVAPAIVNPGRTYTLSYTSVSYDMYIQAWIDYNCDGDFTDAGELVYTTMPGYLAPGTYSTNITIPVTASSGTSRLRISAQYYATTPTTNPCGAFYYGDVEDYKLTILPIVGFDCALTSIDSPAVIGVGNNDLVVTFENKKADSVYWLDLGYQVDNNTPQIVYDYNINNGALLGAGESHQYKFPTPLNIPAKGSYTIKVWVSNVNDSIPDNDPSNDTIIWQACTGMYGTYTIGGTNPDFVDFSEAVAALQQCGISDPVRFDVRPGTYTETITIPEILGASQVNTITFDGNDMTSVKLTHAGTSTQKATIVLDGADYITFQDMTIENIGTTYAIGVFLKGSADYNTIKDCHVDVTKETSTTASEKLPIIASDSWDYSAWSQYGNNAEYTTIEGNHITGGRIGVTFAGGSQTNLCVGNKIIGNHIEDQFDYGTLMYFQFNAEISNNVIENFVNVDARGIGMNNYNSGSKINANIIHPGQYGIYLWYENYSNTTATTYVTNNIISDFKNTEYQRGITTSNGTSGSYSYNLHIYHNSIHVDGSAASWWYYAAISLYYPYSPVIKNNILATTGGNILLSFYGYPNSNATVDNNLYYYPNRPSTYYLFYNNGWFRDVASWKTQTYRINSPHDVYSLDNVNPRFVSNTNLHLDPTYQPVKTDIITGYNVMYDVDGDLRCPYEATIGADESSFPISKPTSNFTSEDTLCFGSPITFLNTADPAAKQGYKWYLNGNLESTDRIWTYTFGAGTYVDTIMLVTANCGGADTFTKIVTIDAPQSKPGVDFLSDLNYIETYYPVNFSDLTVDCPSSWTWTVYPASVSINGIPVPTTQFISSTSNSQNPTISFDYPGKYTVCLTAANVVGADSICKDDYINVKPSQWMCQYVLPEVEEALSGFLFDDGGPFNNYADGNTTCEITLRPCADTITLTFSEFNVATGDYLRIFEGTDNTGRPLWDQTTFPIGLTGVLPVGVSFTSNTGKMFIEWQTDASGNAPGFAAEWNSVQGTSTAPIADFMVDDTVCAGASFAFENLSTGDDLKYEWYFDVAFNNSFPDQTAENPIHNYIYPGTYAVRLSVNNCGGYNDHYDTVVAVQPNQAPIPDFIADVTKPVIGRDNVTFMDMSQGCVDNWTWSISPSTYTAVMGWPNTSSPIVKFNDTGCYNVTLTSGYGTNTATITKTCYINVIEYCNPTVDQLNPDIGISRVILSEIDNSSPIGTDAYTDYSNSYSTPLDQFGSYVINLQRNSTYNEMTRKVWIDWNIDGDYDDPGELVAEQGPSKTLTWQDTFFVPASATLGATRMRIGTAFGNMPNTPCGNRLFGEVEDYRVFVREDGTPPEITLVGPADTTIIQCTPSYMDPGATAWDNIDSNVTADIVTTNNVDLTKPGTYYYTFNVEDYSGNAAEEVRRRIHVLADTVKPTITLNGKLVDTIEVFSSWTDMGYVTDDTCSGVDMVTMMGMVDTAKLGTYELVYTVFDMEGNYASATRTIVVVDETDPTVSLIGFSAYDIEVHHDFVDPGVSVSDNYCDSTKIKVNIIGSVDIHTLGTYNLTYEVTDCNGNGPVIVSRVVTVSDTTKPQIVTNVTPGSTITLEVFDNYFDDEVEVMYLDNYNAEEDLTITTTGTYIDNFNMGQATTLGTYTVIYTAEDESGNISSVEYTIEVVDTEAPVMTLVGPPVISICRFETVEQTDIGVTITDNYDNGLTFTTSGTYFTDYMINMREGFYSIRYTTEDNSNNVAKELVQYVDVNYCAWYSIDEENGLDGMVKVYPNPTNGMFNLNIELPQAQQYNVVITNSIGQLIETFDENNSKGGLYQVDLSNYSDGVYFVKVMTAEDVTVKQITLTK